MFLRESIAANSHEGKILFRLGQNNVTRWEMIVPTDVEVRGIAAAAFVTRSDLKPPRGTRTRQLFSLSKHLRKPTTSGSDLGCSARLRC
jgi:hypothetical protein